MSIPFLANMNVSTWLQLLGLISEIIGAAVLGNAFVSRVHGWKTPILFLQALLGNKQARGYAALAPAGNLSAQIFNGIRGSAFLWVGFVLQLVGLLTQRQP